MTPQPAAALSYVLVTYDSAAEVAANLPALVAAMSPGDELIVVDNASADGTPETVAELAPGAVVIRNAANVGFAAAADRGAERARGELLVLVNPDARPAEGFGAAIRRPLAEHPAWTAWQGLVTQDGGRAINTAGNQVHFTGVSWAGAAGEPVSQAPAAGREVGFASGACLAVRRSAWEAAGGFPPEYFMYCEDLDLCLRLRLAGGAIGIEPAARVEHAYEFMKDPRKWRFLERNRWATVLRTYPGPLLALVAPALLATELAIAAAALAGGWGRHKLAAWADVARALPRLLRERRAIQSGRAISSAEFAAALTPRLSSPYLGRAARLGPLNAALAAYWRMVVALLRLGGRLRSRA